MENIFELKDIVWFFMGWLIPELIGLLIKKISKENNKHVIRKTNEQFLRSGNEICPLSHGMPFYNKKNLILSEPLQEFYFSMPSNIHDQICENNPDFEHTKWEQSASYWGKDDDSVLIETIRQITCKISLDEIRNLIELKKYEIANMFLRRSSEAFFNGEMYGIKELCDRRVGNEEKNKFTTVSFKTDYYTHRVMSLVYQDLLEKGNIAPPEGMNDINKYYPFLTSLGMDVLLVIENKEKVVLAKRSKKLINMKEDQWHLSMNEAVSITDLYLGTIDLEACVKRGLKEELGISISGINEYNILYSDVFFLKNPLEVGVSAFVIIDELTESMVRESYNTAQDAPLESTGNDETGLIFLPFSEPKISKFCQNNSVTSAAKYLLKMLCIRKKQL